VAVGVAVGVAVTVAVAVGVGDGVPAVQVNFWLSLVPTNPDEAMERPPTT
jgi:hypothetical protein